MSPEQHKSPEPTLSTREFLKLTAAGLATIAYESTKLAFFQHPANAASVIKSFLGIPIDCSENSDSAETNFHYDAIIVPGGGMESAPNGLDRPNPFQRLRLEAAAIAFIKNQAPLIVLLDGYLKPEADPNVDKDYLKKEVKRLSKGKKEISDESIIVDYISVNTASNMREMSKISRELNLNKFLMFTNYFHLQRAEINACAYELNVKPIAAEDYIITHRPQRKQYIEDFYKRLNMDPLLLKEFLGRALAYVDPYGNVPTSIKEFKILP